MNLKQVLKQEEIDFHSSGGCYLFSNGPLLSFLLSYFDILFLLPCITKSISSVSVKWWKVMI